MSMPAVGVFLPTLATSPDEAVGDVAASARHAEAIGLESGWVIDQLVTGGGTPFIESTVALAVASAVTSRLRLGLGVLIVPLRPVAWIAKQIGSLQHVSNGRVLLGVGVGGDRHDTSWAAVGVSRSERGRRTDDALRMLPAMLRGEPSVTPDGDPAMTPIRFVPAVGVPPIIVGGNSVAAMRRAVRVGDGWFPAVMTAAELSSAAQELDQLAATAQRPRPEITAGLIVAMTEDPTVPDRDAVIQRLTGPSFGLSADVASAALVSGSRAEVAEQLAAYAAAGAARVVASFAVGDWFRQAQLLAGAASGR
jgi:alkanesulfonate monooxygenase SsuD/methylene tetrahydromethanopterin reductase-like flavin-dependent oxidoreductase (luciferase family)